MGLASLVPPYIVSLDQLNFATRPGRVGDGLTDQAWYNAGRRRMLLSRFRPSVLRPIVLEVGNVQNRLLGNTGRMGGIACPLLCGRNRGHVPGYFIDNHRRQRRAEPGEYRYAVDVPQEGRITPLVLEVPRGLTVRGKVADASGAAAKGIVVAASKDAHIRVHAARAVTDAEGRFEISGLDPRQEYHLSAIASNGAAFAVVDGQPRQPWDKSRSVETVLALEPSVTLTGRVLMGGSPQPSVRLTLKRHHDFKEFDGTPLTDNRPQDKPFTSQTTELQTVVTDAEGRGGENEATHLGELPLLAGLTLAGRIELPAGAKMPADAKIHLNRDPAWDWCEIALAQDGTFGIRGLPAEVYSVHIVMPGFELDTARLRFQPTGDTSFGLRLRADRRDIAVPMKAK